MAKKKPDNLQEKINTALELISSGCSVRESCRKVKIPFSTLRLKVDPAQYTRAREDCADVQFEEMLELERKCLDKKLDPISLRAVIDSRKWRLARMRPKVYGDKTVNELVGRDGAPLVVPSITVNFTKGADDE